jgi:hypothetical protein
VSTQPPSWTPGDGVNPPPPPNHYGNAGGYADQHYYGARGWPPPPPAGAFPPQPIRSKTAPKRLWYLVGAIVVVLGLAGIGMGASAIVNVINQQPTEEHTFRAGRSTTVQFEAGARKVIFGSMEATRHYTNCNVSSPDASSGDGVEIRQYNGSLTLNRWEALFTVSVKEAGNYTISCTGGASDTFGVGGHATVVDLFAGIAGLIVGTGVALVGVVALIITAVLRRRRGADTSAAT